MSILVYFQLYITGAPREHLPVVVWWAD